MLARAARAPASGEWSRLRAQRCLRARASTPYGASAWKLRTAPGAPRSTATPSPRDRGWTYSLVTVDGGAVYWSEARPLEGGRDAIVVAPRRRRAGRRDPGRLQRPHPRARVRRRRLHRPRGDGLLLPRRRPARSTARRPAASRGRSRPSPSAVRPALRRPARDAGGRWLVCVRERDGEPEHVNELVALPAGRLGEPRVIASGHDFYAAPRVSPDGTQLAWLDLGPPADAVGGLGALVAEFDDGALRRAARRRRRGRGDRAARVEPGRRPALQLRPHRLVEPLPRRRRAA